MTYLNGFGGGGGGRRLFISSRGGLYRSKVKTPSLIHGDKCKKQESVKNFDFATYLTPCLWGLKLERAAFII